MPRNNEFSSDKFKWLIELMNRQASISYRPYDPIMPSIIDTYMSYHGWSKRGDMYYEDNNEILEQEEIDLDNVILIVEI